VYPCKLPVATQRWPQEVFLEDAVRLFLVAANTFGAVVGLIWLWGRSTTQFGDWEFYFVLGYFVLAVVNLSYFYRRGHRAPGE
jgi:aminoglycoside phosphotransferase (APT) family kinase protein